MLWLLAIPKQEKWLLGRAMTMFAPEVVMVLVVVVVVGVRLGVVPLWSASGDEEASYSIQVPLAACR